MSACGVGMWAPQLTEFSGRYRVLAFDTRGHGRSDAPTGGYTLDQLAGDLYDLLRHLGIGVAHFVGLSMGGMIGQIFALKYPGIFQSLTIADSTSKWPPETHALFAGRAKMAQEQGMDALVTSTLERWFTPAFHRRSADVAKIGALIRATPVAGYTGCSEAIPRINTTRRLKEIACRSFRDRRPRSRHTACDVRGNSRQRTGSELVVLDDAAHLSNIEQAANFNRALGAFLERCARPRKAAHMH
jgi:3-oxoadipate enol-lactonase